MAKPILIAVDDEPDICDLVQSVAEIVGFDARMATSLREFSQQIAAAPPDVVILDLIMPEGGGRAVIETLADGGSDASLVLMSGYEEGRFLGAARELAAGKGLRVVATLAKPFAIDDLEAVLKGMLLSI